MLGTNAGCRQRAPCAADGLQPSAVLPAGAVLDVRSGEMDGRAGSCRCSR